MTANGWAAIPASRYDLDAATKRRAVETENTFGATLRRIRFARGISQSKLAERAGADHSYVSRLESGSRVPSREMALRIADELNVSDAERDQLIASAGYLPRDVESLLDDQPECRDLLRFLSDEAVPSERREALRGAVRLVLTAMGG